MANKIIFFGQDSSLHPEYLGGTHSVVRRFSEYASESGIDLEIVSFGSNKIEQREIFTVKFLRYKSFSQAIKYLKISHPKYIVSFYLPRLHRIRYLLFRLLHRNILYSKILFEFSDSRIKQLLHNIDAHLLNYSHKIFCISPRILNRERSFRNTKRIFPPLPKNWPGDRDSRRSEQTQVAFIGRFCPGKGYELLPELFKEIEALELNIGFLVSGYGNQTNQYYSENVVELVADQKLWDKSIDEKLLDIYKQIDILLLPYRTLETTIDCPLVVVEAVANGCLVICTAPELAQLNSRSIICTKYEDITSLMSDILQEGQYVFKDVLEPNSMQKFYFDNAGRDFFDTFI